jgi:plastocyanin
VIRRGQSLLFVNGDNAREIYHSVSACRAPCNRSTGIAYPLENGKKAFDSGQLGDRSPAVGRREWRTPRNLPVGTYTYFCRIHPGMRGAFRVER